MVSFGLLASVAAKSPHDWAVCLSSEDGAISADDFAASHHLKNLGEVIPDSNCFHFAQESHRGRRRSRRSLRRQERIILNHSNVDWAEKQVPKVRNKRGPLSTRETGRYVKCVCSG